MERTGIPGRAGNDGGESWNDGGESWNDGGENNGKDKGAKGFPVEPGMTRKRTGMTERGQLERQGGEQWRGQGFPVEPGMTETRAGMTGGRTMERTREQRDSRSSRE